MTVRDNATIAAMRETELMDEEPLMKAAFEAGLQWGRVHHTTHPKMRPYIFTTKGEIEVINLGSTLEMFKRAMEFVTEISRKNGVILLVGTQPAARAILVEYAKRLGFPYVVERWLGGTITNFQTLMSRINHLRALEDKIKSQDFASYTKRERLLLQREYDELREKFGGLLMISRLPDAVFLFGVRRHVNALREARRKGIPVIALANTSDDPSGIQYLIPGNDNAVPAIRWVLEGFSAAVEKGRKEAADTKETDTKSNN